MVIRMRHTRAHTANRRSHHALKAPTLATCTNCSAPHKPHHMCQACGFYKGRMVIDMSAKNEARTARMQAKKEAIKGQQSEEATNEDLPQDDGNVRPEQVAAGKAQTLNAPEMAKQKTSTPRKDQAA